VERDRYHHLEERENAATTNSRERIIAIYKRERNKRKENRVF
jgi:hypothetical protein